MLSFKDAPGEICNGESFEIPRAKETLEALSYFPFYELIECRKCEEPVAETIVVDVEVEISQTPRYDIRSYERIAIIIPKSDELPQVWALREDFPVTPHQYLTDMEIPRFLCLFEESYNELKLKWTPALFLERIFRWLLLTAKGELHQTEQPLEPLFLPSDCPTLIIPHDLFNNEEEINNILVIRKTIEDRKLILKAENIGKTIPYQDEKKYLAICIKCNPVIHGIIKKTPQNVSELYEILQLDDNIYNFIYEKFINHFDKIKAYLNNDLILILFIPIKRNQQDTPESCEIWSFLVTQTVKDFGVNIGIWDNNPESKLPGFLLKRDQIKKGENIPIKILNTITSYSRSMANRINDIYINSIQQNILIGAGALGSQILINCIRMGINNWSIIDHDVLYPHNLSRHSLTGIYTGYYKAKMLMFQVNDIIDNISTSYIENVLNDDFPGSDIFPIIQKADILIDTSTSVPVARKLARDIDSKARRVSIFLNPSGNDSVVLAEDSNRKIFLDSIEMQYYRSIIENETLREHLVPAESRFRYAGSCRDITNRISQDVVAFHASICSRMIIKLQNDNNAQIYVFKYDKNKIKLDTIIVRVYNTKTFKINEWTLIIDEYVLNKINDERLKKIPNETGGVLIGSYDMQRKIIYIVDIISSPEDSEEWPMNYKRGIAGLSKKIKEINENTANMLDYIGEWHSHPDNISTKLSNADKKAFLILKKELKPCCYPPLMMIVGEKENSFYLNNIK